MTEVRTSSLCERPCAGIEDTLEASIGTGGPQSVFDAAMAPTQESGLRENCTSRLSERAEAGRTLHLSRLYSFEAGEQRGAIRRGVGGAKDGDQGECGPAKHALDSEPGSRVTGAGPHTACLCRHTPEVGEAMGRAAEVVAPSSSIRTDGGCPVVQINDLSRSLAAFDPISTLVVVVEMSKASGLVSGVVPGVERQPLKKLEPDATALLRLIERWRNEAVRAGRPIRRIALAYEAGRDGFWLARWLIARGIEPHVIHSASVAVSRERKRAKTDRLDAAMLMRVFLGWLRGERGHCGMVAIPTMEEEDARRPSRERESLVNERSRIVNRMKSALARLGIRGFKAHLRKAPERLAGLRTAEGTGLPANIIEEFRRDMARLALVR